MNHVVHRPDGFTAIRDAATGRWWLGFEPSQCDPNSCYAPGGTGLTQEEAHEDFLRQLRQLTEKGLEGRLAPRAPAPGMRWAFVEIPAGAFDEADAIRARVM